MAIKRMFSLEVVDSDNFYDLPTPSQLLYFHLGMHADVKGFVEPKKVARLAGLKIEDLKHLVDAGFVILFEKGVVVITHWNVNNLVREDREAPTRFVDELSKLRQYNKMYILQNNSGSTPAQNRIEENRIEEINTEVRIKSASVSTKQLKEEKRRKNAQVVLGWFNKALDTNFKSVKGFEGNLEYWLEEYTEEDIKQAIINIKQGKWWAKDPSPTLLFRRKTPKGEPADYIGSLLNGGERDE